MDRSLESTWWLKNSGTKRFYALRFVYISYSSLSWDKIPSLLCTSEAKQKCVSRYERTSTTWMSGNVRELSVDIQDFWLLTSRKGGGVMCESSETFRISDWILKFRMCVMGMSKICEASERLECGLLKENNIKGEQPERCEGSEVLHLFDN